MGYQIDTKFMPSAFRFALDGLLTDDEMREFLTAHNAAVDSFGARPYVVFGDMRTTRSLSPVGTDLMEQCKRYSASKRNFRGSAILVENALVAMQHRRTSVSGGVMATELISHDEGECKRHLTALLRP